MGSTIKDVAKKSRISVATVSKYLNGGLIRESNRLKIEEAIKELNYRVNQSARSLKTNKSMLIGVVVDSITNNFYNSIISYMEDSLHSKNYSSIICETKENPEILKNKLEFLLSKGVDGIFILSTNIPPALLKDITGRFNNIVVIDSIINGVNCDFVATDNITGAYYATEQFILKGHTKIAIITGEDKHFSARERLKGYKRALEDYKIAVAEDFVLQDSFDIQGGYRCLKKIVEMKSNKPTAVLISSYFMTVGSIIAINEENINIPDDLSIICFDNHELNKVFKPNLTYIVQPIDEISETAVNLLIDGIYGEQKDSQIIRIPPKLVAGNSVKKLI